MAFPLGEQETGKTRGFLSRLVDILARKPGKAGFFLVSRRFHFPSTRDQITPAKEKEMTPKEGGGGSQNKGWGVKASVEPGGPPFGGPGKQGCVHVCFPQFSLL
jgi:hypothetical protein